MDNNVTSIDKQVDHAIVALRELLCELEGGKCFAATICVIDGDEKIHIIRAGKWRQYTDYLISASELNKQRMLDYVKEKLDGRA